MFKQWIAASRSRAGLVVTLVSLSMPVATLTTNAQEAPPPKVSSEKTDKRAFEFSLSNGLDVVVIPDHRAPVVTQMVWYKVGAADEPPGVSGIAHFLEHLMFKGTETIPAGQFSKMIARKGGDDNAFTSQDVTAYFQRVAKDRLASVMEMEADRMANLRLSETDVVTERDVILEERRSRVDNDPSSLLQEQMMAALYRNHPYGIPVIGWEHEMRELDREDALDFYDRFYAPENAILIVAGDVKPDDVLALAKKTFGKIPGREKPIKRERPEEPEHEASVTVTLEDPRAGRTTVQRYYTAPSYASAAAGEAEALDLLARVMAHGSTGRIYKSLVVDEKAAASAGGWYSDSGLDSGRIGFYAIAGEDDTPEQMEAAIDKVIDDVRENGVTQDELDRARAGLLAEYVYTSDSISRMARQYGWRLAMGLTVEDVEDWPNRIKAITVDDVRRVAMDYLVDENSVTGILKPSAEQTSRVQEKPVSAAGKDKS
ncbi:MAG: pitrilysin family protein [Methyloceanibacter sp.]|nr:pitrilysin family protein [Methyloceanibacter sp.]